MRRLRTLSAALLTALVTLALSVSIAFADSPHFIFANSSLDSAGNLVCSFKEAGLGTTLSTATISCSASASATWACLNGGGNHPKAANKETFSGEVSQSGNFPVRNGQTTGSLTVNPPGPDGFSCPSGQRLVLAEVSYTNIAVSGEGATTLASPSTQEACLLQGVGIC